MVRLNNIIIMIITIIIITIIIIIIIIRTGQNTRQKEKTNMRRRCLKTLTRRRVFGERYGKVRGLERLLLSGWLTRIENCVPEPRNEEFSLDEERARKVITKKRHWSAPGPDRIVSFWWKKVGSLIRV